MGGRGSGTWYRWNTKRTIEDVARLDIRTMIQRGWLTPGRVGRICWGQDEQQRSIGYKSQHDHLDLFYRYRLRDGELAYVEQTIYFDLTACHYGNCRRWFLCPNCNRRCALLYGAGQYFFCRKCYRLSYSSQSQGKLNRMIEQKHKLGDRIFDDYDGNSWKRKKGRHQVKFNRLHRKYLRMDMMIDRMIGAYF